MRKLELGEQPQDGKLYVLRNQSISIFRDLDSLIKIKYPRSSAVIPKNKPFMFVRSIFEMKLPAQVKHIWFQVIYGETAGVCYNGQIPFHQFINELDKWDLQS